MISIFLCPLRFKPGSTTSVGVEARRNSKPETICGRASRIPKLVCLPSVERKEIDLFTSIGALDFDPAAASAIRAAFNGVALPVLGLEELIYTKLVSASR